VVTPADLVTLVFVKPDLAPHAGKTCIAELTHLTEAAQHLDATATQ
jgi:hypothetical protein